LSMMSRRNPGPASRACLLLLLVWLSVFGLSSPSLAITPQPPAAPADYVVDLAGIINDDVERRLDERLKDLELKTTIQMVVLTVTSLDGASIEDFSIKTVEKWKLGQKGKDNGILLTIALKDRKYRIEVGYGLESVLPDSLVGSIGREQLVPPLRKGDYNAAVMNAATAIIGAITSGQGGAIAEKPAEERQPAGAEGNKSGGLSLFDMLLGGLFLIAAIILFIKHPGLFIFLLLSSGRGGGGDGWSGGGGFGGGGGGGFGGGGASGDW